MAPFVEIAAEGAWRQALRTPGGDDLGTALTQFSDDPVCVESLVCDQSLERDVPDERGDTDGVVAIFAHWASVRQKRSMGKLLSELEITPTSEGEP